MKDPGEILMLENSGFNSGLLRIEGRMHRKTEENEPRMGWGGGASCV